MSLTDIQKQFHENADEVARRRNSGNQKYANFFMERYRYRLKQSGLGKLLLNWADDNNIKIMVDYQTSAAGYYCQNLKFIGINPYSGEPEETIAHEIFHAIQDSFGLIGNINNVKPEDLANFKLDDYIIRKHFYEAAAFAIGRQVGHEIKNGIKNLNIDAAKIRLQRDFDKYYEDPIRPRIYEETSIKIMAEIHGIKGIIIPYSGGEFDNQDITKNLPFKIGLDVNDEEQIRKVAQVLDLFNFLDNLEKDFHRDELYREFKSNLSLVETTELLTSKPMAVAEYGRLELARLYHDVKEIEKKNSLAK
jgi:hypothetical protein